MSTTGEQPYYRDDAVTLWHGDCREVTAWLEADVLVTDPPYGQAYRSARSVHEVVARTIVGDQDTRARDDALESWGERPRVVFGARDLPPIPGTRLIWHKPGSGMGDLSIPWKPDYEFIYVRGRGFTGERSSSVLTYPLRVFRGNLFHPHEKPIELMRYLIARCPPGTVADPFAGSGTTLVAAKALGRRAVGIEVEERYCEVAARSLSQEVLELWQA